MKAATQVRYTPHADDMSWSPDWHPSLFFDEGGESRDWDDLGENEFVFILFWVDVTLEIGGSTFRAITCPSSISHWHGPAHRRR
jgi:hypothetical protein